MQWSLFVLFLMGQCSLFTCHLYEYHFIQEEKSWDEAQKYCREHYTDLATVSNMRDLERLRNSSQTTDAWIGLHSISAERSWHWSLPGVEFNYSEIEWGYGQPNHHQSNENCVVIRGQECHDFSCNKTYEFICYNESTQTYHCVNDAKNWLQAQSYCREHHTDLVSGIKHIKSAEFKEQNETCTEQIDSSKNPDRNIWIGLFRDTWSWSDGKNFSFRHWDPDSFKDVASKTCAMTMPNGTWSSDNCTDQKPFYCYDDKVILINENKTWDEALDYCRENHHDLVSITDHHQQRWVEKRAK
ncbi:C-type mannose receptor 2-like, partial [Eleginops maclovinus]|uniref:C-type mannose receptor 2-like n=1 Tax=Eleginops maclovinus TaxID=56733 RepID=UPI0030807B70